VYPDEPFAEGRGSFLRPVLPPPFEPGASPTKTVAVNCSWLPYIRGALMQLLLQATWKTDDPAALLLAQERVFNLIDLFTECSSSIDAFSCDYDIESSLDGAPFTLIAQPGATVDPASIFTSGVGFTDVFQIFPGDGNGYRRAQCGITFSERHITFIVVGYDLVKGTFVDCPLYTYIQMLHSGSVVEQQLVNACTDPDGSGKSIAWAGDHLLDEIRLYVLCGSAHGGADPGGSAAIRTARIDGYVAGGGCPGGE